MGRFTLMDWLGLPTGVIVLLVVLMALFMFWGAEQLERIVGKRGTAREPKWRYGAAGTLVLGAAALIVMGQPTTAVRWSWLESTEGVRLADREVQIHPGELLERQYDNAVNLIMLDLRPERDYNLFHLLDARRVAPDGVTDLVPALHLEPENTLIVLMSNDEKAATEAWKILRAESVPNVYILEGGVNNWLATFADEEWLAGRRGTAVADDQLAYRFDAALGAGYAWAKPLLHAKELNFTPKIQMEIKRSPGGGGCG
jgi:rhodanese-related sulfurtransferase